MINMINKAAIESRDREVRYLKAIIKELEKQVKTLKQERMNYFRKLK